MNTKTLRRWRKILHFLFFRPEKYFSIIKDQSVEGAQNIDLYQDFCHMARPFYLNKGRYPDLVNPKNFTDKIIYKRLFHRFPIYTKLADKYAVREFVQKRIGSDYLIPLLASYTHLDNFDFDNLPDKFVIKAAHGCGQNLVVKNKRDVNLPDLLNTLKGWLNINYYNQHKEWQYKNIPPRLTVEYFIEDEVTQSTDDYKFYCFNGKVHYVHCIFDRTSELKENFYTREWKLENFYYVTKNKKINAVKPRNYEQMVLLAESLSKGFDYVRVDLYNVNGRIYFGELSFTPYAGYMEFSDKDIDHEFGKLVNISIPKITY
jgi:hypothetical protein